MQQVSRAGISATLIAALSCAGCMPVLVHHYYRPEAAQGRIIEDGCRQRRDSIEFQQPHLLVDLRVLQTEQAATFLEIRWEIEPGKVVALDSPTVQLFLERSNEPMPLALVSKDAQDPSRPMVGGYLPTPGAKYRQNYWLYAQLPAQIGERFRVRLPAYHLDGGRIVLPEVQFRKETSVQYFAPLQC